MATRATQRAELEQRLGDTTNDVWSDDDLNGYLNHAYKGLYPTFFLRKTDTTTAGAGPMQTPPTGARNIYFIGLIQAGATRVQKLRRWVEGDGEVMIPKLNINGLTLTWAWTAGWDEPATDGTTLTIPLEAEEFVIIRAHIAALEHLLTNRVKLDQYLSLALRQATTEDEIATTIDALHASLNERARGLLPLPQVDN